MITSDVRQIHEPLPSDIKFTWEFTKAPDDLLLMYKPGTPPARSGSGNDSEPSPVVSSDDTSKFRIRIRYLELYVPRLVGKCQY